MKPTASGSRMKQNNVDRRTRYGYNGKAAVALGIVQLVLGTGCLVIGIICIFQLTSFGYIGHGVWCGTMVIEPKSSNYTE